MSKDSPDESPGGARYKGTWVEITPPGGSPLTGIARTWVQEPSLLVDTDPAGPMLVPQSWVTKIMDSGQVPVTACSSGQLAEALGRVLTAATELLKIGESELPGAARHD